MSGILLQALDIVYGGSALSRRRQGFETPWDCQLPEPVFQLSPPIFPQAFSPLLLPLFLKPLQELVYDVAVKQLWGYPVDSPTYYM